MDYICYLIEIVLLPILRTLYNAGRVFVLTGCWSLARLQATSFRFSDIRQSNSKGGGPLNMKASCFLNYIAFC